MCTIYGALKAFSYKTIFPKPSIFFLIWNLMHRGSKSKRKWISPLWKAVGKLWWEDMQWVLAIREWWSQNMKWTLSSTVELPWVMMRKSNLKKTTFINRRLLPLSEHRKPATYMYALTTQLISSRGSIYLFIDTPCPIYKHRDSFCTIKYSKPLVIKLEA